MANLTIYDVALAHLRHGIHRLANGDHHDSITPQQMYDDVQKRAAIAVAHDNAYSRTPLSERS